MYTPLFHLLLYRPVNLILIVTLMNRLDSDLCSHSRHALIGRNLRSRGRSDELDRGYR